MTTTAILVHGLGRTPFSMRPLAKALRKAGLRTHAFTYVAAFEDFDPCARRLARFIERHADSGDYIVIGHSLGTVLLRTVVPRLARGPKACFFLAPPTVACRMARLVGSTVLFRWLTGDMGRLLSDPERMARVPVPDVPTTVYVGTAGPYHPDISLIDERNDGILSVSETALPGSRVVHIHALHSFIMYAAEVAQDIVASINVNTRYGETL